MKIVTFIRNLAVEELADVVFDTAFIAASGIDETGAYLLDLGRCSNCRNGSQACQKGNFGC